MTRRWTAVATVALAVAAAGAAAAVVVRTRAQHSAHEAARVLGSLPAGYRYVRMDPDEASATIELFRDRYDATDVAVTLVEAPQDQAPIGVTVVALVLRRAPDPRQLAHALEHDVPLVDPQPTTLAGQPVLTHEADATLASATLWVHGRLAVITYGATTAEVDGVMAALLAGGAWRSTAAA